MKFTYSILTALLASTTLTLPTTDSTADSATSHQNTTFPLQKRDKWPWIGSFPTKDCSGPVAKGDVGHIELNKCYIFTPNKAMPFVGVNYGSGGLQLNGVTFFADADCKKKLNAKGTSAGMMPQDRNGEGMKCNRELGLARSFKPDEWDW